MTKEMNNFLKSELLAQVQSGRSLTRAIAGLHCKKSLVQRWRREDQAFAEALQAALAVNGAAYTAEEIKLLKAQLVRSIAEDAPTVSAALDGLTINWCTFQTWRRADPDFDAAVRDAIEIMTERQADRMTTLHEEIEDPRKARVASENRRWWIEARNPRFRPRAPVEEPNVELTQILKAAVNRLIEMTPPPPPQPVIEAEAEPPRRVTFRGGHPSDTHRP